MWKNYYHVTSIEEALQLLAQHGAAARIIAGGTDLMLEMERGVRKGITTLVDMTRVSGLDQIMMDEHMEIHLGPMVTHNQCVASQLIVEHGFPLAQAAWEVGAPQIRNRGTIAGNLITASPANDTITPLMALGAKVTLRSVRGERQVPLAQFYTGVRRNVMQPDELLTEISFPALPMDRRGTFVKIGLRRAQAISVVNAAVVLTLERGVVSQAVITLGAVAPTIVRAPQAEEYLEGKALDEAVIESAALLAQSSVHPIDDVRGSAEYRNEMVRVSVLRALRALASSSERANYPEQPVLLEKPDFRHHSPVLAEPFSFSENGGEDMLEPIVTCINGKEMRFVSGHHKSLLRLLREDAGLIGTKEGCAEGECGACTVILDGKAVMSCLVPAARAHLAEIETVEGLAQDDQLHPVQQAFMDAGAVQCGYCTPGFLMSAAALLEEQPQPTADQVKQAITGNLCRCTGYYKIVQAIEMAAQKN